MISGLNFVLDKFKQENTNAQNAQSFTSGAYFQDTWDISDKVNIESGLRIDKVHYKNNNYSKNQIFTPEFEEVDIYYDNIEFFKKGKNIWNN